MDQTQSHQFKDLHEDVGDDENVVCYSDGFVTACSERSRAHVRRGGGLVVFGEEEGGEE